MFLVEAYKYKNNTRHMCGMINTPFTLPTGVEPV